MIIITMEYNRRYRGTRFLGPEAHKLCRDIEELYREVKCLIDVRGIERLVCAVEQVAKINFWNNLL